MPNLPVVPLDSIGDSFDMTDAPTNEQESPSLDFILQESRHAHNQLLDDLDSLDARAAQQIQTGLVVIGAVFAAAGTGFIKNFNAIGLIFLLLDIVILALCVIAMTVVRFRGEFYSGRIFPDILQDETDDPPAKVKAEVLDTIARSYYYNYTAFIKKGKRVSYIGSLQIAAMVVLVGIFIAEAIITIL